MLIIITLIFIPNCILQIVFICMGNNVLRGVTKVLIIPLMLLSYFLDAVFLLGYDFRSMFLAGLPVYLGLIFGWLGDIFLLSKTGFVKSLLCFLLWQIFYPKEANYRILVFQPGSIRCQFIFCYPQNKCYKGKYLRMLGKFEQRY